MRKTRLKDVLVGLEKGQLDVSTVYIPTPNTKKESTQREREKKEKERN